MDACNASVVGMCLQAPPLHVTEEQFALSEMGVGLFEDPANDDDEDEAERTSSRKQGDKQRTAKERVRRHRHRKMEKEHDSKRELKRMRRELDSLPQLTDSITTYDEACAARRARQKVCELVHIMKAMKSASMPPFFVFQGRINFTDTFTGRKVTLDTVTDYQHRHYMLQAECRRTWMIVRHGNPQSLGVLGSRPNQHRCLLPMR